MARTTTKVTMIITRSILYKGVHRQIYESFPSIYFSTYLLYSTSNKILLENHTHHNSQANKEVERNRLPFFWIEIISEPFDNL